MKAPAPAARFRFSHFSDLPMHPLNGIRGVNRAPDVGVVFEEGRKIIPVVDPGLDGQRVLLAAPAARPTWPRTRATSQSPFPRSQPCRSVLDPQPLLFCPSRPRISAWCGSGGRCRAAPASGERPLLRPRGSLAPATRFRPSMHAMNMSSTPLCFKSVNTDSQNLAPSFSET